MSLHDDLLSQAKHLAHREPRRPRQASLRRAISTAYYAMFHLLIHEATSKLVSISAIRGRFARAFEHGEMKKASKRYANQPGVSVNLQQVAETFVDLQEARHEADYNVTKRFTRQETKDFVLQVEQAFQDWNLIRTDPIAHEYLAALLLGRKWNR